MAGEYVIRGRADMSKHDANIKKSAAEVYQYKKQVEQAKASLKGFSGSASGAVGSFKGLSGAISSCKMGDFAKSLSGSISSISMAVPQLDSLSSAVAGLSGGFAALLNPVTLTVSAIAAVGAGVAACINTYADYETHLNSLSALTGLSGEALD